ncbi:hypothetical protein MIMGU_mgv1a020732mg [Erythranthe guttata]|uniref:NB-ARC domain-containing protein n=1 Tax=Erythranthe guttata TaxID=4155 RepID=A0A022QAP3_ERYGU|nr:hypothetical protein MIMGU_mgv1a020732mg [Erythranthe guttata]
MAAYAALLSLKQTIDGLSKSTHISIIQNSSVQIIQHLYEEVRSLRDVLSKLDAVSIKSISERVNAVDEEIRDAVSKFEDAVDFHVSDQLLTQLSDDQERRNNGEDDHGINCRRHPPLSLSVDLQELNHDVHSFAQTLNKLKQDYVEALSCTPEEEEEVDFVAPSRFNGRFNQSKKMVGLSDQFTEIRDHLTTNNINLRLTLWGMAGIGKTTLAEKLFQDPLLSSRYDIRAFVTLGPKCRLEDIYLDILKQVDPNIDDDGSKIMLTIIEAGEDRMHGLKRMINERLQDRKFFIVLDDVWDEGILNLDSFEAYTVTSHVLLTTRLKNVAEVSWYCNVRFLDKKESWELLRFKVFDEMPCPPELEKAGKKIAENCDGLPLTIVTVADTLSEADRTVEYWNNVAVDEKKTIIMDAYAQMYKVLYPSYNYLSQFLKPLFLYMGIFPQNCEITYSRLYKLSHAEGIIQLDKVSSEDYFQDLVFYSLAVVHKTGFKGQIKLTNLHSSFWYLCNIEARKSKFFYGLNFLADGLAEEDLKNQRRLCIRNNVLFGIKETHDSMASISAARSLLCTGPYHQYPVRICFGLMLLRLIDALTIRFYEFPMEVVKLVQLRYFALTYDGMLPASISKLWKLKWLIVSRHLSIVKSAGTPSYLPMEIWDMKEVEHIQVMGSDLPDPCEGSPILHLYTLLDVSTHSCTEGVLKKLPYLRKLGIRIELSPDEDVVEPLCCFDHISCLDHLEALKCVIVNPKIMSEIVAPPVTLSTLSSNLVRLTLSGLGYPWEEMTKISSLPYLRVLKLLCYAFRGPKWQVRQDEFPKLDYLLIEDTDLVLWTIEDGYRLDSLVWLTLKQCYKLEEIPMKFSERTNPTFSNIVLQT